MMDQQPSNESLFDLQVDYESGNYFKEATKWSKFIAIVSFCFIGFFALMFLLAGSFIVEGFSSVPGMDDAMGIFAGAGYGIMLVIVLIILGIFLVITIQIYRFASRVRAGIERQDQVTFNRGLGSLKLFFIIWGVLSMLALVFSLLSTLGTLI